MDFLAERGCGEEAVAPPPMNSEKAVVPAPFLTKTYHIVDDHRTDHIVSWGVDCATFVVWRPPDFARDLLPKYFKHSNFSSFLRQLNTYGFRKIVADRWEFANEFFKKGEKQLLKEIRRRRNHHIIHSHHHHLHHHSPTLFPCCTEVIVGRPRPPLCAAAVADFHETDFLSALSEDNRRLRRRNALLLSEIAHMKKLYSDIVHFLRHHTTPAPAQAQTQGRVTIREDEEEDDGHDCSTVKLFGVPLQGN